MSFRNGQILVGLSAFLLVVVSLFVSRKVIEYEEQLKELAENSRKYYLLADTMRRTSQDLTKMAKMYVVTGNESYKNYFYAIKNSRYNLISRPEEYHKVYLDIVLAEGSEIPGILREPISRLDLLRNYDLTDAELERLKESERNSDGLINLEIEVINTLDGLYKDKKDNYTIKREPNKNKAQALLHNNEYNLAKASVMKPILEFSNMAEERISRQQSLVSQTKNRLRLVFNISTWLALLLVLALALFPLYLMLDEGVKISQITKKNLLSFVKTNTIESWPISTATLAAIFTTIVASYLLFGNVQEKTNEDLSSRLEIDLQFAYDTLTRWTDLKNIEASMLADSVKYLIRDKFNNRLNLQKIPQLKLDVERRMYALEDHDNSKFIILDRAGRVITSNTTAQIEDEFEIEQGMLDRLTTSRTGAYYLNDSKETPKLTNNKIELMFGTTTNTGGEMYIVILVVPISEVSKVLKRTFLDSSGELYLVNSEGRLITENVSFGQFIELKMQKNDSAIGHRISTDPTNLQIPLVKSVANVIDNKINEDVISPYTNYLGIDVIGSWKWNDNYDFGVIREINKEDAFGVYDSYVRFNKWFVFVTTTLILMLFSIFVVNRAKSRKDRDKLNTAYQTIKRQQDRLDRDLEMGKRFQEDMLPDPIEAKEFSVYARLKPAQMVSGDFYDFSYIGLNQDKFYFSLGDVSGKGIPAALMMSATKFMINKIIDQQVYTSHEIVTRVNRELCQNNSRCFFVTLVLCVVDLKTGRVQLTNAGHDPPRIKKRDGTLITMKAPKDPVLGIFDDIEYSHEEILLDKKDNIICYTDGVTEAQNDKRKFYGEERLMALLKNGEFNSPKDIINAVSLDVSGFIKEVPQFDDITLLSFEYRTNLK